MEWENLYDQFGDQALYWAFMKLYGVRELNGDQHNPLILEMLQDIAPWYKTDETPWCGAIMNWVCKKIGLEHFETYHGVTARKWKEKGTAIDPADVHKYIGSAIVVTKNHVGVFGGFKPVYINKEFTYDQTYDLTLGGNQKNKVGMNFISNIGKEVEYRLLNVHKPFV